MDQQIKTVSYYELDGNTIRVCSKCAERLKSQNKELKRLGDDTVEAICSVCLNPVIRGKG